MNLKSNNQCFMISHLTLRKLIGILGMLLPFACLLGGSLVQNAPLMDSISAYYHSNMQDIFVGLIICFSLYLMTYRGYDKRDIIIGLASGIAGVGIVLFPCESRANPSLAVGVFQITPPIAEYLHYGCSALFFILLGIYSFFLFTRGDKTKWTKSKSKRNVIYRICGLIIFASLLTLGTMAFILDIDLKKTVWTFVFETVMLLAFGTSWIVKGETLYKDRPGEPQFDLTAV